LYEDTALASYTEICEREHWKGAEIAARHKQITEFAVKYLDTDACKWQ
jgi:hypothetical protein